MKKRISSALLTGFLGFATSGQGVFQYDQQSSTEAVPGESWTAIHPDGLMGQSFTPSLSAVGFIRLELVDLHPGNALGATLVVNLRSGSITGTILGTSSLSSIADGFNGFTDFLFNAPISVVLGTMYYIQPVIQSGDVVMADEFIPTGKYAGGSVIIGGVPDLGSDLWFREGIIVPEPSISAIALLGTFAAVHFVRRQKAT